MADDQEAIVVDTTKEATGKVTYFGKVSNPTPTILARATKALRYFAVSLITMVSATDLFTGAQSKVISFSLGVFILALGAVDIVVGVAPSDENNTNFSRTAAPNDKELNNK